MIPKERQRMAILSQQIITERPRQVHRFGRGLTELLVRKEKRLGIFPAKPKANQELPFLASMLFQLLRGEASGSHGF